MKTIHKTLLATILLALIVLLTYRFIAVDREKGESESSVTNPRATTDTATEMPDKGTLVADDERATEPEAPTQRATEEMYAQMKVRYGEHYAVHEMNPRDIGEGERIHLGVYLAKGDTKKELGVTSLGRESYRNKTLVTVAITDGTVRIERWGNDGYTGNAWTLKDEVRRECESLNWRDERQMIRIRERGHADDLGTTRGGWKVMIEFWKFEPKMKDA